MAYEPGDEHLDHFVFFDEKEYEAFIKETSDFIYEMIQEKRKSTMIYYDGGANEKI